MMNPETEVTESCLLYGKPEWTNNTTVHLDEIGFSIPGVRFHGTEHYALKSDTMYPIGDVNSDGLMDILLCGTEVAELTKGVFWIVLGGTGELPNGGAFSVSEIGDRFDGSIIPSSDDLRIFHETSDEHIAGDYFGDLDGDEVDDIVLPMTTAGSYLIRGIRGKESPVYRSAIAMNGSLSPIGSVNGLRGRHNATKLSIKFSGDNGSEVIAAQKFRSSERIFSLESPATALWKVSSPTAEWRNGSVELRYTGEEIGTLNESLLRIYTASSPRGPWTWLEDFHESHPQQNRISTLFLPPDTNTGELYFALAEVFSAKEPAEPVDIAWDIVEIKKIDDADMNRDGLIDSADIVALEIN